MASSGGILRVRTKNYLAHQTRKAIRVSAPNPAFMFDEEFQMELGQMYADKPKGHPPVAPAQLCLTLILQAYTSASDDEAIEALQMDRRWQLVLDCLDCEEAAFAKGTLVEFRATLIEKGLDRRLVERTIQLAQRRGGFSSRSLRAALDSSPLWGVAKVEDTYNLLGHALGKALSVIARQQGRELAAVAALAGAELVSSSSLKAALDLNWDDPQERTQAFMRHGRKSHSLRVDGYKRHLLHDLDSGLVRAVGVTAANAPEATVTDAIVNDLNAQKVKLKELHIDRAYLSSRLVKDRGDELTIYCKAWSVRSVHGHFPKTAFTLNWKQGTFSCPNQVTVPLQVGKTVRFPAKACASCPLQSDCTTSKSGRSVSIHPDEQFLQELRERQLTPAGRAKLRQRTAVEHSLAHVGHWQGDRARYRGLRKNLFDLRRMAIVHNLHVIARMPTQTQQEAA